MKQEVPVVLFAFNRTDQLKTTLRRLKENQIPKLIVFCDGSRGPQDDIGVAKVKKTIDQIDWTDVEVHKAKSNLGLSESIQAGLNIVFNNYEAAIVIEDDVFIADAFYDYMVRALVTYQDDQKIAGVTGLRYPFKSLELNQQDADVFLAPRFSSWGWGTWQDRWQKISFDLESLKKTIEQKHLDIALGGPDLATSYRELVAGRLSGCWDVYFYLNMLIANQYFVWPKKNLVENGGLSEGSHASGGPGWELKFEGTGKDIKKMPSNLKTDDKIVKDFLKYFKPPRRRITVKSTLKKFDKKLHQLFSQSPQGKPDPKDYSTTDGPMEVPCQKESYFLALNNYIKTGDKVLDVGIGIGYGMNIVSIKAGEVHGVDVDKKAVDYCNQHVLGKNPKVKKVSHYDGYNLPYKDSEFDTITCVDVLEHVEDYDRFIDELLRVTKKFVFIATPNRRPEYTNPDGTPTNYWHLREWSQEELAQILGQHKANVDWNLLNGPWEGPFSTTKSVQSDTLVLAPALRKK